MNEYLSLALQNKLPEAMEIEIHLFELCNLNCTFCGQDHNSKVGLNTIGEKAIRVIDILIERAKNPAWPRSVIVNVMGGEIFNDDLPPEIFDDYLRMFIMIDAACRRFEIELRMNFVTNLIFGNTTAKHVAELLSQCDNKAHLSTSYDLSGRGLDLNRKMTFKKNLEHFKPFIGVVGFVLTKPAINVLLADDHKFFTEYLYGNFPIYFDHYVPEGRADKMLPNDEEQLKAFKFIVDKYPKIAPIADLLENKPNRMTCYSPNKVTIRPDGKEVTCRYLSYKDTDFNNEVVYSSNENIIEDFLEKNQCLSCQHFDRCGFRCFVQWDWKELEKVQVCIYKQLYEYIDEQQ